MEFNANPLLVVHCPCALQEALSGAEGTEERQPWRRALWRYLAAVHDAEPGAAAQYHELQVGHLCTVTDVVAQNISDPDHSGIMHLKHRSSLIHFLYRLSPPRCLACCYMPSTHA